MYREGKKCVVYVRVSTEMQVDGYSLDGQRNILKKYAEREGMIIIDTYEDAGKSGKSIEGRPAFQKMINDIENGLAIDYILVYKLSRFGRNTTDVLNSLELIQQYDVNLISVEDGIDSSQSSGKLLISLLSSVSEIERENIIEQTMNGRREKARQGEWNGGFAPYGYDLVNGKLTICEEEAETVKMIFDMYTVKDYGCEKIAKELNLRGIKKKVRQNGTLELWSRSIIRRIVANPVYVGKIAFGRRAKEKIKGTKNDYHMVPQKDYILSEGKHEAIIIEEIWNLAADKIHKSKKSDSLIGRERIHYLSGILRCPRCGGPMYASKYYNKNKKGIYKEYYFYECSHHKSQRGHPCSCNLKIMKPNIEPYVIELLKRCINNEDFINQVMEKINDKVDASSLSSEKELFEAKLKEALDNKNRVENELDNMPLDTKYRERKIHDLNKRLDNLYDVIDELESKINGLNVQISSVELGMINKDNVINALNQFDKLYDLMSEEEKKEAITGIISEINVHEEAINNNYIKNIKLKFNIYNDNQLDLIISGTELNDIEDLSIDYMENTYLEIPTDKEYQKERKNYYIKKNKVTYKKIKDYVKEHFKLNVHSSYIAEVKRKHGIDMQAKRDKENAIVKHPTKVMVEAIEDALRFYKII